MHIHTGTPMVRELGRLLEKPKERLVSDALTTPRKNLLALPAYPILWRGTVC